MTNHVHLLLTPHAADVCALLMKYLSQCYVQRINRRTGRSGTLWEGRFRSCLVASEHYALACYRYILDVKLVEEIRKATRGGYVVGSQRRARGRPARKMGSENH